jgi:hypothetical protein
MRILAAFILFLASSVAMADPWCLVRDENTLCRYQTAEQCYDTVAREGGSCRENYQEVGVSGNAPYCIVTSTYRRCTFRSRDACVQRALAVNGGCVQNIERELERSARLKRRSTSSDSTECEDLACELAAANQGPAPSAQSEQVIIEFDAQQSSPD